MQNSFAGYFCVQFLAMEVSRGVVTWYVSVSCSGNVVIPTRTRCSNLLGRSNAFIPSCIHYRTQVLCRVSQTLGKGRKTLGKLLAECSTRQSAHGLSSTGEAGFAECLFSGTRQTFAVCQAALGKKSWNGTDEQANWRTERDVENFAEYQKHGTWQKFKLRRVPIRQHSAKFGSLPSATRLALGNDSNFAECLSKCTRWNLFQ